MNLLKSINRKVISISNTASIDSESDNEDVIEKELARMDSKRNQAEIVPEEEDEEEEDEDADYITLAKKLENCQLYSKAVDTEDLMISSIYVEYELKLANGDVNEV